MNHLTINTHDNTPPETSFKTTTTCHHDQGGRRLLFSSAEAGSPTTTNIQELRNKNSNVLNRTRLIDDPSDWKQMYKYGETHLVEDEWPEVAVPVISLAAFAGKRGTVTGMTPIVAGHFADVKHTRTRAVGRRNSRGKAGGRRRMSWVWLSPLTRRKTPSN